MQSEEYEIMKALARKIVERLTQKKYRISFAETITGGGIAKEIIKIPGSSQVVDFTLVPYSDQSKIDLLKVPERTLIEYGAVSEETVKAMVDGLLAITNADVGLAVSGIAGPGGATEKKPIGMVCVALRIHDKIMKETWMLGALDRETIIEQVIDYSLQMIADNL